MTITRISYRIHLASFSRSYVFLRFLFFILISFSFIYTNAQSSNRSLDQTIEKGIEAFRKTGAIQQGAACAHCHAPDGLDLAYFNFDVETLIRRIGPHLNDQKHTADHLTEEDVESIIDLVDALRTKYDIDPRDPIKSPPFQPGGSVLPGETVAEQDGAFAQQLVDMGFHFATVPILDRAEAEYQLEEWLSVDPRVLKIGIPLNPWSRDPFFEGEHASIADWLPDFPRLPKPGSEAQWLAIQDEYLANPSDANLLNMIEKVSELTITMDTDANGAAKEFMKKKYESVLYASHFFRKEVMEDNCLTCRSTTSMWPLRGANTGPEPNHKYRKHTTNPNPIWKVGDIARRFRGGNGQSGGGNPSYIIFSDDVLDRIDNGSDKPVGTELKKIKIPWFWAGWLLDQSLQYTPKGNSTANAEYFSGFIRSDFREPGEKRGEAIGYTTHAAFMITRKLVVQNFDPDAWDEAKPLNLKYSNFHHNGKDWKGAPKDADNTRLEIYTLLTENSYKMFLFALQKHIKDKGLPKDKGEINTGQLDRWRNTISNMENFFNNMNSPHKAYNLSLAKETKALL